MKRTYIFKWYATKDAKYREADKRISTINITNAVGKTAVDAKHAVEIFCKSIGNLHKNTIVSIKEFDEQGVQIGEDIVPSDEENSIVPTGR